MKFTVQLPASRKSRGRQLGYTSAAAFGRPVWLAELITNNNLHHQVTCQKTGPGDRVGGSYEAT